MKTLKKTKRTIAYFLVLIFMTPSIISCSSDITLEKTDEVSYNQIAKKYDGILSKLTNEKKVFNNNIQSEISAKLYNGVDVI